MDNFPYYGSYKGQKNDPVPLDSVGGTVLWVDANLHREGVIFPPFYLIGSEWDRNGYDGIETEGICYIAKAMLGNQVCFGLPSVVAFHTMN